MDTTQINENSTTTHLSSVSVWVQPTSRISDHVLCSTHDLDIDATTLERAILLGTQVIFEHNSSVDSGSIVAAKSYDNDKSEPTKPTTATILRLANSSDIQAIHQNDKDRDVAMLIFGKLIADSKIPGMKPISVRYTFDRTKIIFSFTAKSRVDFRTLAKDLSKIFRSRVEIRQIPIEYEVRQYGSAGVCGRAPCCNTHAHLCGKGSHIPRASKSGRLGPCGKTLCCDKWQEASIRGKKFTTLPKVFKNHDDI